MHTGNEMLFDIELSSHCNANCYFCPRDSVPFLKNMEYSVFEKTLARIYEISDKPTIKLCGTGDATMSPDIFRCIELAASRGFDVELTTNGICVDSTFGQKLIDSGLRKICFSIADIGKAYEAIYDFSFKDIVENVRSFHAAANNQCEIRISLIHGLVSGQRLARVKRFWMEQDLGKLVYMDYTNRAGLNKLNNIFFNLGEAQESYEIDGQVKGICPIPFKYVHIGADGTYYLCSHDFARRVAFGNVLTHSLSESMQLKFAYFKTEIEFCKTCSAYPANQILNSSGLHHQKKVTLQQWLDLENKITLMVDDAVS